MVEGRERGVGGGGSRDRGVRGGGGTEGGRDRGVGVGGRRDRGVRGREGSEVGEGHRGWGEGQRGGRWEGGNSHFAHIQVL